MNWDLVNQIEWHELHHAYGAATDVPNMLLLLSEPKTYEEFKTVLYDLWNNVNHQGSIYEATPTTIRFMIELIREEHNIDKKSQLIACIADVICDTHKNYISDIRWFLNSYDNIALHTAYFIQLLSDDEPLIQLASLYLLSFLHEKPAPILPHFLDCITTSTDTLVVASAINVYTQLAKRIPNFDKKSYVKQASSWLESASSPLVQYISSYSFFQLDPYTIPPKIVMENLVNFYVSDAPIPYSDNSNDIRAYLEHELLPLPSVNKLCQTWVGRHVLTEIVKNPNLTPIKAHYFFRELFNSTFARQMVHLPQTSWLNYDSLNQDVEVKGIIYEKTNKARPWTPNQPLDDRQQEVISCLVNSEPFWKIRTNLLSFFYGLPDDRVTLSKLLKT